MALWPLNDTFKSENLYNEVSKNGIIGNLTWKISIDMIGTRGNTYCKTPFCKTHFLIHPLIDCEHPLFSLRSQHSVVPLMVESARHISSPWVHSLLEAWYCSFGSHITLFQRSLRMIRLTRAKQDLNPKENGRLGNQLE